VRTLAIDPGRDTGWAIVDSFGELLMCGLGAPPADPVGVERVIIERPQVYRGRSSKGDPNDLITLAIQVGRYLERYSTRSTEEVLPRAWKGTMDPDILCERVVDSLLPREYDILSPILEPLARKPLTREFLTAGKRHNVIDAVGLAKWSAGPRLAARFRRVAA
jgi:hypothetical protein